MQLVQINTIENVALDWAVATALGGEPFIVDNKVVVNSEWLSGLVTHKSTDILTEFSPSTSFDQGGQLINHLGVDVRQYKQRDFSVIDIRHFIKAKGDVVRRCPIRNRDMVFRPILKNELHGKWLACEPSSDSSPRWNKKEHPNGDTFLIAAMRWVVVKNIGQEILVPRILLNPEDVTGEAKWI